MQKTAYSFLSERRFNDCLRCGLRLIVVAWALVALGGCASTLSPSMSAASAPTRTSVLPAHVLLPRIKRTYPTLQPKMPPPARHLYVANISALPPDQKRLLVTLQGIVNRTQPRIYLIWRPDDQFWLRQMQKQGQTGTPIRVKQPLSLVRIFRGDIRGAVIPDPKVYISPDIAVDIAAVDRLVVATPALARQLNV
ncbi:hypothetical protein HF925_10065, partial [Acidithiobacillus ferriphilus]|nr:hypothetical protein [Acidithiobacillus ferriphilus]